MFTLSQVELEQEPHFNLATIPFLLSLCPPYMVDYDKQTDTLYVSYKKPQLPIGDYSQGDIVYHYGEENLLVGITVLNAAKKCTLS